MKPSLRLASVTALALTTLLGCQVKLDHEKIEKSITDECKSKGLELKSVSCPADQLAKEGDKFDCEGKTADGEKLAFHVTQTSSKGDINWKLTGTILDAGKLGDSIESKVGKGADVKCDNKTIVLTKGKSFSCKVAIDDKEHTIKITAEDDEGNVRWKIED